MATLKLTYESEADIPDGFAELYTEKDDAWILTGVEGIKTQADVDRVLEGHRKERNDHKATKDRLKAFGDLTPEDVEKLTEERDELLAQVESSGGDPKKIEETAQQLVELRRENSKYKRELDKATATQAELEEAANSAASRLSGFQIDNALQAALREAKVLTPAMDDALLLGRQVFHIDEAGKVAVRDEVGFTPGAEPKDWIMEIKEKRPHWWGENRGAGATGGKGDGVEGANPFRKGSFNMTQIANIWKSDSARAKRLHEAARAAGDLHEKAVIPS